MIGMLNVIIELQAKMTDKIIEIHRDLAAIRRQLEVDQADEPRARKPREKAKRVLH